MARKLKVFQTSLGFFDLAIAAPSMKAALEAWGADSNLFHQGAARESTAPEVVAATMAKPGVILRRPVGSDGPFREHADLPTRLSNDAPRHEQRRARAQSKKQAPGPTDEKAARKAALAFEAQEKRRESERRKQEAAYEKKREQRQQAVAKAESALEKARQQHDSKAGELEAERTAIEKRLQAEDLRWEKHKEKLETAVRRARD